MIGFNRKEKNLRTDQKPTIDSSNYEIMNTVKSEERMCFKITSKHKK